MLEAEHKKELETESRRLKKPPPGQVLARRPRYIEIKENTVLAKYKGEAEKMGSWFAQIRARSIPYQSMYPKRQRCDAAELFWSLAPECIQSA